MAQIADDGKNEAHPHSKAGGLALEVIQLKNFGDCGRTEQ